MIFISSPPRLRVKIAADITVLGWAWRIFNISITLPLLHMIDDAIHHGASLISCRNETPGLPDRPDGLRRSCPRPAGANRSPPPAARGAACIPSHVRPIPYAIPTLSATSPLKKKNFPTEPTPPRRKDGLTSFSAPAHPAAPEMTVQEGVPQGTVYNFTLDSKDSKFYPGIAREPNTLGTVDADDPANFASPPATPRPTCAASPSTSPNSMYPAQSLRSSWVPTGPIGTSSPASTTSSPRSACRS